MHTLSFFGTRTRDGGFLQSKEWSSFQESYGKRTLHFERQEVFGNGIFHSLPLIGQYIYFPRGPLFLSESISQEDLQALIDVGNKENVSWLRIEPQFENQEEMLLKRVSALGATMVKAPHDVQPKENFVIDVSRTEEEILSRMKQKTRYNIRLAEKRNVKVYLSHKEEHRQAFLDLISATADRKEINPHPRAYYEKLFLSLPEDMCFLFVAEFQGKIIAANIVCIFGEVAWYLHGGTSDLHREVMAPYLLQWEQIKFAKAQGATRYDFGGVRTVEKNQGKSSWMGITRFKQGFDPAQTPTVFPGTFDIIINKPAYFLYRGLSLFSTLWRLLKRA